MTGMLLSTDTFPSYKVLLVNYVVRTYNSIQLHAYSVVRYAME